MSMIKSAALSQFDNIKKRHESQLTTHVDPVYVIYEKMDNRRGMEILNI